MTSSSSSSSSAQVVASIDDLLTAILLRLPIESLIRSEVVSKRWQSLITNPQFRLLRNANPSPPLGLFLPDFHYNYWVSYECVPLSSNRSNNHPPLKVAQDQELLGVRILQSCNGLLLCCSYKARVPIEHRNYVCNPTTNKFSKLPRVDEVAYTRICGWNLAFDPAKSPHYKVVCVRLSKLDSVYGFEVYSSEAGHWRTSSGKLRSAQVVLDFENGVYWNGSIHWMGAAAAAADSWYLNLQDEVLHKMPPMPPPMRDGTRISNSNYFGECGGHLHYAEMIFEPPRIQSDVHEMKRDYSCWFLKYRVDLLHPPWIIRNQVSVFSLVRGERNGKDDDDSFLVLQTPGILIRCNLISRTFQLIPDYESEHGRKLYTHGFKYIPSLCSV